MRQAGQDQAIPKDVIRAMQFVVRRVGCPIPEEIEPVCIWIGLPEKLPNGYTHALGCRCTWTARIVVDSCPYEWRPLMTAPYICNCYGEVIE